MSLYNEVKLSGQIAKLYPLKKTPVGLNVVTFVLKHTSTKLEGESNINVNCRMFCVWVNPSANDVEECMIDRNIIAEGFISHNSKEQLVLHIKNIIFLDKGF